MKKIKRILRRLYKGQQGNVLVLVAGAMMMIFGFTAIVVDGGSLYFEKSELQKIVDAAVLGGAQGLPVSESNAKSIATDIANENGLTLIESDFSTGPNFIEVTKTVSKDLTLAKVLGFNNADVASTARAELAGPIVGGEGLVPVAVPLDKFDPDSVESGIQVEMNFQPNNNESGNFGFLDLEGTGGGANELAEHIKFGGELSVSDPNDPNTFYEYTETGLMWGPVESAFEYRINEDQNKAHCQSWDTADNSCERVIIVPLVETFTDSNGKKLIKIVGFASFWIEKVQGKTVYGRFIETVTSGVIGTGSGPSNGVYSVKLVK